MAVHFNNSDVSSLKMATAPYNMQEKSNGKIHGI